MSRPHPPLAEPRPDGAFARRPDGSVLAELHHAAEQALFQLDFPLEGLLDRLEERADVIR